MRAQAQGEHPASAPSQRGGVNVVLMVRITLMLVEISRT
jgi:hypothetical protein